MAFLVEVYTAVDGFPSLTASVQLNNFDDFEEFARVIDFDEIRSDELRMSAEWAQVNVWESDDDAIAKHQMRRRSLGVVGDWLPVFKEDVDKLYQHESDKAEERRFVFLARHEDAL